MSEIEQLESQMENNKRFVRNAEKVHRLMNNNDFKEIILEGFCTEECARFAQVSTDPRMTKDDRADALGNAQASGYLTRFLHVILRQGADADTTNRDIEQAIDELRAEGAD